MRTVYSEIRGRIVDSGVVGRRVMRAPADNGTQLPYAEVSENSPIEQDGKTGMVRRTFTVDIYQQRGMNRDPMIGRTVQSLFNRQRWDYYTDDANTELRRIIARAPVVQFVDRPSDGVSYDTVTVIVRCAADQP